MLPRIIKRLREKHDYSQEYMAHCLSISQPAYSKIEKGKTNISVSLLFEIAFILEEDPIAILAEAFPDQQFAHSTKKLVS